MATPEGNSIPATVSGVLRLDAAPGGGLLLPYDCAGIAAVVVAGDDEMISCLLQLGAGTRVELTLRNAHGALDIVNPCIRALNAFLRRSQRWFQEFRRLHRGTAQNIAAAIRAACDALHQASGVLADNQRKLQEDIQEAFSLVQVLLRRDVPDILHTMHADGIHEAMQLVSTSELLAASPRLRDTALNILMIFDERAYIMPASVDPHGDEPEARGAASEVHRESLIEKVATVTAKVAIGVAFVGAAIQYLMARQAE